MNSKRRTGSSSPHGGRSRRRFDVTGFVLFGSIMIGLGSSYLFLLNVILASVGEVVAVIGIVIYWLLERRNRAKPSRRTQEINPD